MPGDTSLELPPILLPNRFGWHNSPRIHFGPPHVLCTICCIGGADNYNRNANECYQKGNWAFRGAAAFAELCTTDAAAGTQSARITHGPHEQDNSKHEQGESSC